MEGHIYIYGEITSYQGSDAEHYGAVNPRDVMNQLKAAEGAESLTVHINSNGGDVDAGFAIYDLIKSFPGEVTTLIEGQCYSIATVILLAGTVRKATENSGFLIHLPSGWTGGTADEMEKYTERMRKIENKIAKLYAAHTSLTEKRALKEMEKDDFMELTAAKELGFITEIIPTLKAVAKYNLKTEDMDPKTVKKESLWAKLKASLSAVDETVETPENIVLKSATGEDYEFPERNEGEIQVGDKALVNGQTPKNEEVLMASGDKITFDGGKIAKITPKEEDPDISAVVKAAVDAAVKPLQEKLEEQNGVIEAMKKDSDANKKVIGTLKALTSEIVVEDDQDPSRRSDPPANTHVLDITKLKK